MDTMLDNRLSEWLENIVDSKPTMTISCDSESSAQASYVVGDETSLISTQALLYTDPSGSWNTIESELERDAFVEDLFWVYVPFDHDPLVARFVSRGPHGEVRTKHTLLVPAEERLTAPRNKLHTMYIASVRVHTALKSVWSMNFCRSLLKIGGSDSACLGGQLALHLHKTYKDEALTALGLYKSARIDQLAGLEPHGAELSRKHAELRETIFSITAHCLNNMPS